MIKRFLCLLSMVVMTFSVLVIGTGESTEPERYVDLSWSHASFIGEEAGDLSGECGRVGDVNGDGFDDIMISSFLNDEGGSDAGQSYLFLGKRTGWSRDVDLSKADASFIGEMASDRSGISVSGAGDVNGDGYDDILIGGYFNDERTDNAGQTYLIFGKASGWAIDTPLSTASASFLGEKAGDLSGRSVSGAGDVNGDGNDDILIGAYYNDERADNAGQTYLILGKKSGWAMDADLGASSASFLGDMAGDNFGVSVSGAGDVNGDDLDDILIGAWYNDEAGNGAGQSYLFFGRSSGWAMDTPLSTASASFWGEDADDWTGYDVQGAGDVNNDGYDDILINAYVDSDAGSNAGQTYLIFGRSSGWALDTDLSASDASFLGEKAGDWAGNSNSGKGDVNGDGFDDILIGAQRNDFSGPDSGQVYLIYGKTGGWAMDTDLGSADGSFLGETADDEAGASVSLVGDLNGDGYDDILVGAPENADGGSSAGKTYLILSTVSPPGPKNLNASLVSDKSQVTLQWEKPDAWGEPIEQYRVYRSSDGNEYSFIGSTKDSTRFYSDNVVSIGAVYHYRVIADYDQGDNYLGTAEVSILCDIDTDGDGVGNMADWDDDDDNITDYSDAFPIDSKEWLDSDLDGEGNEADKDDDNDGTEDTSDPNPMNPLDPLSIKLDALTLTITSRFDSLEGDLAELEGNIEDDILTTSAQTGEAMTGIMDRLEDLNGTLELGSLSENLTVIRSLLDNESDDALPALFTLLSGVIAHMEVNLTGLLEDIASGQNISTSNLNDLERSLEALEDLESIMDAVETLQGDVDDTEEKVASNNDLTLYLFILTIVTLCIMGVILLIAVRSGGRKKGRSKDIEE